MNAKLVLAVGLEDNLVAYLYPLLPQRVVAVAYDARQRFYASKLTPPRLFLFRWLHKAYLTYRLPVAIGLTPHKVLHIVNEEQPVFEVRAAVFLTALHIVVELEDVVMYKEVVADAYRA